LLTHLDRQLDRRLVQTVTATITAILTFRHRAAGLLLSELGAFILSPAHAPASTKRLSNLLRSPRWAAATVQTWLWIQAAQQIAMLHARGETPLLVWDTSVLESAESPRLPDLCPVRSAKAARFHRHTPGYCNPPSGWPIMVPGLHWLGVLVVGATTAPWVAAMRWWTTRGAVVSCQWAEEYALLRDCWRAWGRTVTHIWDRGYASAPWLIPALEANVRFVLRWKKGQMLLNRDGDAAKAWEIARGKRTWSTQPIYDTHTRQMRRYGVVAMNVTHPAHARPLWLVVARPGQGREPWYLLTSDPAPNAAAAWRVVFAYAKRWQIEQTWRYGKSELAMESPRVWTWDRRLKLLVLVTLAYAFLLSLMDGAWTVIRARVFGWGCHRTGQAARAAALPLYRLRAAISQLWLMHRPQESPEVQTSG
jgi:hypothetical protein